MRRTVMADPRRMSKAAAVPMIAFLWEIKDIFSPCVGWVIISITQNGRSLMVVIIMFMERRTQPHRVETVKSSI